jgi:hypothetical protein
MAGFQIQIPSSSNPWSVSQTAKTWPFIHSEDEPLSAFLGLRALAAVVLVLAGAIVNLTYTKRAVGLLRTVQVLSVSSSPSRLACSSIYEGGEDSKAKARSQESINAESPTPFDPICLFFLATLPNKY